jgi:hypothetical protein
LDAVNGLTRVFDLVMLTLDGVRVMLYFDGVLFGVLNDFYLMIGADGRWLAGSIVLHLIKGISVRDDICLLICFGVGFIVLEFLSESTRGSLSFLIETDSL